MFLNEIYLESHSFPFSFLFLRICTFSLRQRNAISINFVARRKENPLGNRANGYVICISYSMLYINIIEMHRMQVEFFQLLY